MKKISRIAPARTKKPALKKVAAYARVSMETDRQRHSLAAQVSYYSALIQKTPGWEYAGVYADDGISGTGTKGRSEFLRLLSDCETGNIDTLSSDGELLLTLLASFAQEESRSISENVKWGTRKRFANGIPNGRFRIYGYRWEGDKLAVVPEDAEVVKLIYSNYLKGVSGETTENSLPRRG